MKKNVAAQTIGVQMINSADGTAFTGSATVEVTVDNGIQGTGAGAVAHKGNGYHTYVPSQAETNGDFIAFTFLGTGAIPATIQVYTGFPQTVDNDVKIDLLPLATDIVSSGAITTSSGAVSTVTTCTTNTDMVQEPDNASITAILEDTSTTLPASIDALPTAAETTTAVWSEPQAGYTTAGTFGDNLDAQVSLVGAGGVTAQGIRDAMKLAPSAGAPAAGSLDEHLDDILADTGTDIPASISALPAATDIVSGGAITTSAGAVTTVTTCVNNTDMVQEPDNTSITNILTDTSTTIPNQISGLNDVAATDIVSNGAITTLAGAVVNVDTVDTTTTNTDMKGTDNALLAAGYTAPDNAGIAQNGVDINLLPTLTEILNTAMSESYAADGVNPTLTQALFLIQQTLTDFNMAGTTYTARKLDGTTTAATFTMTDGTNPTGMTRTT